MIKTDTKQRVLLAVYMEYQKDLPRMGEVTAEALNMDTEVFNTALDKLMTEGFISDVLFFPADNDRFYIVNTEKMRMTRAGIELIENKFGIAKELTAADKLGYLVKKCGVYGWTALKMFGAEALKTLVGADSRAVRCGAAPAPTPYFSS